MKPQPIENLLTSKDPLMEQVATTIETMSRFAVVSSIQLKPITLGIISRELGTPCDIEDIGDNMSKYSIDLEIRGDVCKVWAVGESISK